MKILTMKQLRKTKKDMLCSIFNHKLTSPKRRMSAEKITLVYAITFTPKMISYCHMLQFTRRVFDSSFISFIVHEKEFSISNYKGVFWKTNSYEMHDCAQSHSGLFKRRISNFLLLRYYSVNSFLFERSVSESKLVGSAWSCIVVIGPRNKCFKYALLFGNRYHLRAPSIYFTTLLTP